MSASSGSIISGIPVVIGFQDWFALPATTTLKSGAAGRLIEYSTDGGVEYFTPTYDRTSATMLISIANARLSHIRITGQAGDTWSVR